MSGQLLKTWGMAVLALCLLASFSWADPAADLEKAKTWFRSGSFEEALNQATALTEGKALSGDQLRDAHILRARCLVVLGRTAEAESAFQAAHQVDSAWQPDDVYFNQTEIAVFKSAMASAAAETPAAGEVAAGSVAAITESQAAETPLPEEEAAPSPPPPAADDKLPAHKGIKAGIVNPGEMWYAGYSADGEIGYSLGAFLDAPLGEKLFGGVAFDLDNDAGNEENMLNLGLTLKAGFSSGSKMLWRPGLFFGYGYMTGFEASFFAIAANLEIIFLSEKSTDWLLELAVIGGPSGGNEDADMSYGPGYRLRAGIAWK